MITDTSVAGSEREPPFINLRVAQKKALTQDIFLFELRHPDGLDLPPFTPGAHLTVQLPNGMRRNYSLSSDPAHRDYYQIAVKRDAKGRGGSVAMVDEVHSDHLLPVSVPRNNFELMPRASDFIFVAGGIGITPIMSMMRHLKSTGRGCFKLYYCTRDPESTAFLEELKSDEFAGQIRLHHDYGDMERAFDFWASSKNRPRCMCTAAVQKD